jgi:hypothetical protein
MYHIKGRSHEKCSLPGAVILPHVTVYNQCLKRMSPSEMQTPDIVYLLFACLYKKCYLLWVHIIEPYPIIRIALPNHSDSLFKFINKDYKKDVVTI